jgi:hypothetical protein
MRKLFVFSLSLSLAIAFSTIDLQACGDKLLSLGQGARVSQFQTTKNPRSILLYQHARMRDGSGVKDSGDAYKRMGHRVRLAKSLEQISQILRSDKIDYVIADPSDLAALQQYIGSAASKPKLIAMTVPARAKVVLYASLIEDGVRR